MGVETYDVTTHVWFGFRSWFNNRCRIRNARVKHSTMSEYAWDNWKRLHIYDGSEEEEDYVGKMHGCGFSGYWNI